MKLNTLEYYINNLVIIIKRAIWSGMTNQISIKRRPFINIFWYHYKFDDSSVSSHAYNIWLCTEWFFLGHLNHSVTIKEKYTMYFVNKFEQLKKYCSNVDNIKNFKRIKKNWCSYLKNKIWDSKRTLMRYKNR